MLDNQEYRRMKPIDDNKNKKVKQITGCIKNEGKGLIKSDVNGSYTGMAIDDEKPVQDADDL